MMDWFHAQLWKDGNFRWWEIVGWAGNAIFSTRFFIQWYATEKKKRVVVPTAFWWLSLVGSLLLLSYAIFAKKGLVFIFAYAIAWVPYLRNIMIQRKHSEAHLTCPDCAALCPPHSNFCPACGARLAANKEANPASN